MLHVNLSKHLYYLTLGSKLKMLKHLPILYSKIKSFLHFQCKSRGGASEVKKDYKERKRNHKYSTKKRGIYSVVETDKRKGRRRKRRKRQKKQHQLEDEGVTSDLGWQCAASTWSGPYLVLFFFFVFFFFTLTNLFGSRSEKKKK